MAKNTTAVQKTESTNQVAEVKEQAPTNRILKDGVDIKALYQEHKTHSGVIRYLNGQGYTRSEIALALGKRYQHVRNVLIQDAIAQQSKGNEAKAEVESESKTATETK